MLQHKNEDVNADNSENSEARPRQISKQMCFVSNRSFCNTLKSKLLLLLEIVKIGILEYWCTPKQHRCAGTIRVFLNSFEKQLTTLQNLRVDLEIVKTMKQWVPAVLNEERSALNHLEWTSYGVRRTHNNTWHHAKTQKGRFGFAL